MYVERKTDKVSDSKKKTQRKEQRGKGRQVR